MNPDLFDRPTSLTIVGPSIRTSMADAARDIPTFWRRFLTGAFLDRLPRRPDDAAVYAVYFAYDSDYRGAYDMLLGVSADPSVATAEGIRSVVIPPGRYARFPARGRADDVLWSTWRHASATWDRHADRRYAADYERHPLATLPALARGDVDAEVVVGLR